MIQELGKESIVLLSTHIVSDIEHIADRIIMMEDGRLIYRERGKTARTWKNSTWGL